jgi:3D (Asp-Asp-Asp) domain-containing protein
MKDLGGWALNLGLAAAVAAGSVAANGCRSTSNAWLNEPVSSGKDWGDPAQVAPPSSASAERPSYYDLEGTTINEQPVEGEPVGGYGVHPEPPGGSPHKTVARRKIAGRPLGKFRNTYYDFPAEDDYQGQSVALKDPDCDTIKAVPRPFYEAVCVQGSGTLKDGSAVSFAKRDCSCAEVCPRTGQRICFDQLDRSRYPWGRGANGTPITPLLTVAVDSDVISLGTPIYIPELDGLPRDEQRTSFHDGCFIAQDRGLRVKGRQVDVFTGSEAMTKIWNRMVPSNEGVHVYIDNPRCARAQIGGN